MRLRSAISDSPCGEGTIPLLADNESPAIRSPGSLAWACELEAQKAEVRCMAFRPHSWSPWVEDAPPLREIANRTRAKIGRPLVVSWSKTCQLCGLVTGCDTEQGGPPPDEHPDTRDDVNFPCVEVEAGTFSGTPASGGDGFFMRVL
jgi:hypothetical protein